MQIKTTRSDDRWRKSLGADDAAALVAVFTAELDGAGRCTVAQVAEPKQLLPVSARRPYLEVSSSWRATPDVYVAVVAGGLVATRGSRHLSLENAAAACVACVANIREPVTYVSIAGELVRVRVRIERGYDRERRKVLESWVYTPEVPPSAAAALARSFDRHLGGNVRLAAFAVDDAAFAVRAHGPAYVAAVVARVCSLIDWDQARAYRFGGALLFEHYGYDVGRAREAVASVSAARIDLACGLTRRAATVSAATLETYEESGPATDEWLEILAQNLATKQAQGGDGILSAQWGWPDPDAPRAPK